MAAWQRSFCFALEHIVGPQAGIETISIGADDRMEARRVDIADAVGRADAGAGVIILTDMFGGTPSNLAISLLEIGKVEVVAGLNLPMLVKLARVRKDLEPREGCRRRAGCGPQIHQHRQPDPGRLTCRR